MKETNNRIIVIQPALPAYRLDFFDKLSFYYGASLKVYYSHESMGVLTEFGDVNPWAEKIGNIEPVLPGVEWQHGVFSISIRAGDVIVISGAPRCISNMFLFLKARLCGAKAVWWGHYWSSTTKKHRFILRMLLMRLAHSVLFYTDQEVDEYRKGMGKLDKRKISALNNGINTDSIVNLRVPYVSSERPKELLFIGRLTEKSEIDLVLKALAQPGLEDVFLSVIGDGPDTVSFISMTDVLGISDRVVWHGATTDEARIASIANQCRAFVYPGAVGLSLIHSMAYGLPSIVHDERFLHMPEIAAFEDGETGVAFHKGDTSDLANVIRAIIDQTDVLDYMSKSCLNLTDNSFNTKKMAKNFIDLVSCI